MESHEPLEALDTTITRDRPDTAVLAVRGEVDMITAPRFESAVGELLDGSESAFTIDLSGVTFLASSGLAVLIRAAHRAEERGLRIRLVVASRVVQRPLEVTGTDQLFEICADVDASAASRD